MEAYQKKIGEEHNFKFLAFMTQHGLIMASWLVKFPTDHARIAFVLDLLKELTAPP